MLVAAVAAVAVAVVVLTRGEEKPAAPVRAVTMLQDDALFLHRPAAQRESGMRDLATLGVDWLRITAGWSVIAPDPAAVRAPRFDARDPAAYPAGAWDALDAAVRLADRHGLRTMIDVGFWAPRWAVSRPVAPAERQRWEVDPDAFGQFAEAVARRYSGHYDGLPGAAGFTVWSEPNYQIFLLPQRELSGGTWVPASPRVYRAMVRAAVPAIRRAAPDAVVLIGATAPWAAGKADEATDGVAPLEFLRRLACVDDRLQPLRTRDCRDFKPLPGDGWSHHPYSMQAPPAVPDPAPGHARVAELGRLDELLGRLHAAGRTEERLPIYVTEYGYETNPPDPGQPWTPEDQARLLPEAELLARRLVPGLRSWAQFELQDLGPRHGVPASQRWSDFQTGLRFANGKAKPAFESFRLPLVVRAGEGGRVRLEGRVRPGSGRRPFRIGVRLPGGRWVAPPGPLLRTDEDGYFAVAADARPATGYRIELPVAGGGFDIGPAITVGD